MKNNSKIIVIVIIVVIIILSVGYALFSENINVTGTATAEGSLDLEIVDAASGGDCWYCSDETFSLDKTSITMSATLLKPGAYYSFQGYIRNNGSVDAKLQDIMATPEFNSNYCVLEETEGCELMPIYFDEKTGFYCGVFIADVSNMQINSTDIVIPAGTTSEDYMISIQMGWQESWATEITEAQTKTFTVDFNFAQSQ